MQTEERHPDALLVGELKRHNQRAFRTLYDRYRQNLYRYSLALLKTTELAEENVQDVFLKAWLRRETLDPDKSFRAWLFTVARNQAFNLLQKAANDTVLREAVFYASQQTAEAGDMPLIEAEFKQLRKQAVRQLPPKRRKIFKMAKNKGMSYEEISAEMGISVHTVRNQMAKALESLRGYLRMHDGLYGMTLFVLLESWLRR